MRILKKARLVVDREEGTRRIYSVDMRGVVAMRTYLDKFWDRALASFQAAFLQDEAKDPDGGPPE